MATQIGDVGQRLQSWAPSTDVKLEFLYTQVGELRARLVDLEVRTGAAVTEGASQVAQVTAAVVQTAAYTQGLDEAAQRATENIKADLQLVVKEAQSEFTAQQAQMHQQQARLDSLFQIAQAIGPELDQRLAAQMQELDQKIGTAQAQMRQANGAVGSGGQDPWLAAATQLPSFGAAWQGGGPSTSGGPAAAPTPVHAPSAGGGSYPAASSGQSGPGRQPYQYQPDYAKLFDDKVALSSTYAYAGGHGAEGEKWRRTTRGYWIAKFPAVKSLLDWAERQESKEIDASSLTAAKLSGEFVDLDEGNATRLSQCVWGFLNNCVTGEARAIFDGADVLNGLDGWRRIVQDIQKNRWVRREQLRNLIKHVPKMNKLEDIAAAVITFDNNIKLYEDASGKVVDPEDKKSDLMAALPTEIREQLQWRMSIAESYGDFRNHLVSTANNMLFQRGKFPSPVQVVDDRGGAWEGTNSNVSAETMDDAIVAALGRMGIKGGKGGGKGATGIKGGGGAGKGGAGAGEANHGTRRCINCGSTQHLTVACNKPEVPREKRPCWKCGKPGHIGADCRSAGGQRPAKLVEDEDSGGDFFGCVSFQKVKMGRPGICRKPMPAKVTLWNHVEQSFNRYAALADNSTDDKQERENTIDYEAAGTKTAGDIVRSKKKKTRESSVNEMHIVTDLEYHPPGQVAVCDYAEEDEEEEDDEVNAAEDVITVPVALDSGTVEHVAGPAHMPASTPVVKPASGKKSRNFVGANGSPIANYGEAAVEMEQEDGKVIGGSFHVADVTRPLHSTSRICDSVSKSCPAGHEVLYTKGEAVVVPEGAFSRFLGQVRRVATYKRTGGLYVAKMKLKAPRLKADFTRQGPKQ